ncbi:MAG: hypothetical protein JWO47_60 [Candidatus Saccharibacteria bacterium]|nr:hypothetical protein [Candidatus Saccharibacteria bacterium]
MVASSHSRAIAACENVSSFGAVTVRIPTLPSSGIYNLWTRMQTPDTEHNQYNLEINGGSCFAVGGSSITPGQWTWVSFQDGDLSSKVHFNFDSTDKNTARLIGTEKDVKIDRLLLVKTDCVPAGDGSNCQSDSVAASAVDISGATQIPSPSTGPVSGLIIPSPTISQNEEAVLKVVYSADGKPIPTTKSYMLDTTLLSNGSHQIAMQISRTNGTTINEATTITVQNPEGALSPLTRWARLNQGTAVTISSVIGGLLLILATLLIVRHIRLQKRLLEFKGF